LNKFTAQQQTFAEAKGIYRCICNGTSDKQPPHPRSYEQSQVHKFRLLDCEEIWDFGLTQRFLRPIHKQSFYSEGNSLKTSYRVQIHSGIMLCTSTLNTDQ